jgi:serine/threonine protein kinase
MADPSTEVNRVDDLAEEFARRLRAGEQPSVEEYACRHPQWADEIRVVLPAVALMERLKPRPEPATPSPSDPPPRRVGEYRILREIGRGGMGVVYEAEQETLGRRVAVKLLAGHLLANETLRSRFRREATSAARLHHTNIVPVFGVGECDGRGFYVMQLINGRGLDRVLQQAAAFRGAPKTEITGGAAETPAAPAAPTEANGPTANPAALPPLCGLPPQEFCREVARLGAQVADALAAAHSQGVLHRDVKPSNLLLDDRGCVWVTDFGVAKLVEEANLTSSGDLVGTLRYMPPERFAGRSEAGGDVYSLGVTLCEMLTLRPAFPDANPQHLIHLITHEGPIPPRRFEPAIPPDLETVVLKAAARDPAHRYPSAADLADDLRRFLDDRPIRARRTGPVALAWRWCRRNPALASATAAAFLLLLAASVVSVVAYATTAAANREAAHALASEKAQREHAEDASTLALEALNRIYDRFAPTRLVVAPQDDNETPIEPPPPALPPEAVPLLEDLLLIYERLARTGVQFPRLQPQAAEANYRIGDINRRLGRFDKAADAYRAAIDLYDRLPSDPPAGATRIKLARACNELGRTLHALHQFEEAVRMHRRAVETLIDAPKEFTSRPECRYELARSWRALGQRDMLLSPGRGPGPRRHRPPPDRPPEAPPGPPPAGGRENPTRRAVDLLERLVEEFPGVPEYRHLLACCLREAPPLRADRAGRSRWPDPGPDRAVDLLRKLVADFPNVPDYRLDLCEALGRPGPRGPGRDPGAKKRRLQEAITLSARLVEQYPNVPDYSSAHARYLDALGMTLLDADQPDEAVKAHRQAVQLQQRLVKEHPKVVAHRFWLGLMERSLGSALSERGEWEEARARLESAVLRVEALWKKDNRLGGARPFLGMAYRDLARTLARSGEPALADEARRKAEEFGKGQRPGPFRPRERSSGRR